MTMASPADLEAVLTAARAQQRENPAASLALFKSVAECAASMGKTLLEADAWLGCGESVGLIDGRERESLAYLRRAAERAPDTTIAALSWLATGDMLRWLEEADPAADAYSQAATSFERLGDAVGECLARTALGRLLMSLDRVDEAVSHIVCASSLALDTSEPELAAELQLLLGERLSGLKRHSEAIPPLRTAAELSRMVGNAQVEARARGVLLNALLSAHPDAGAAQHEQMARMAELFVADAATGDNSEAGRAARLMLSTLMGDHAPDLAAGRAGASGSARRLSGTPAATERPVVEANARLGLAAQLLALGRARAGFAQFRQAAELYSSAGHLDWAANALLGCAHALLAEGRTQESVKWFSLAASQFEAAGDQSGLVQSEAARLEALADLQQWDEIGASQKILAITEGDGTAHALMCRLIALGYQARALTSIQDHTGAAIAALQAADLASELGEREREARLRLGAGHSLRLVKRFPDAAEAYEQAIAVFDGLPDASGWEAQALEGLGAVLRDSPQTGAERLGQLSERYADTGDRRMEALCRQEQARCLELIRPARHAECAAEYAHAARVFDEVGDSGRAGDCLYGAAKAYNWLGLLHPEHREACYRACMAAADRFGAAGNMWGKGLAELMAGHALRQDDPAAPRDPRNLPVLRQSVRSLARAGRVVEETGSRLAVAAELCQVGTDDAWMAAALLALRRHEVARAALLIPQRRQDNDKLVRWGLFFLGQCLWRAWAARGGTQRWLELAWRLEQAAKGRSFLDEHRSRPDRDDQDEVWNSLVASDDVLRGLESAIEHLILRQEDLTSKIDTALLSGRPGDRARQQAEERDALGSDLENAQRLRDRRVEEVARERPDQTMLGSVPPVTLPELQASLWPGEVYVGYLWNGGSMIRSVVTTGMVRIQATDGGLSGYVTRAVAAARDGQTPPDMSPEEAAALLGPVPAGTDTLIISPDGLLNGFPWHLVPLPCSSGPGQALGDRYTTAVIPTAGILPRLRCGHGRSPAAEPDGTYLGVACDGAAAGRPLAYADDEVRAIAQTYFAADSGSGFLTTADCHQLLEQGCRVRLLHLACHARRNGLLLSGDGTWVTPVDLAGRGLRADILLLTGCSAGDFSGRDNNEFFGVVRQLLIAARSRAAVVSVAPVPDHAAPIFADFVVSALTGHNPGRPWAVPDRPLAVGPAVAWARRALAERNMDDVAALIREPDAPIRPWDPRWWAPWFVVGDPRAALTDRPLGAT
jgi:tetratricopeptide (TPR) repeat protein